MWGLLDPPEIRRKRAGSFYRRWTWRRQIAASGTRLLVASAFALFLWGAWYLANRGFGREFRTKVVEELHRRGIDATVGKLTLDPFRGLVARDLRIYEASHRERPLVAISEVALDINYSALLHHKPFLDAVDVRSADVTFPAPDVDPHAPKAQLTDFRAHVYFPPSAIYVSQAEGVFCGIRISATGQLINRPDRKPSAALTEAELRARMQLLQRIAAELGRFKFAGGPPSLQLKFTGDTEALEKATVEASLRGERIQRDAYEIKAINLDAEWRDEQLSVTRFEIGDNAGAITAGANWNRLTGRGEYQAHSSIALKPFLNAIGFGSFVADLNFTSSPQLEISGSFDFKTAAPRVTAIGSVAAESFTYKTVPISDLNAQFSWDGERTMLRNVRIRHATGDANVEMLDAPNDFRLNIESTINPVAIRTLIEGDVQKFLGEWELPHSPTARMAIRGTSHNPQTWSGDGAISLQRARFRGVWANSATANIHLGQNLLTFSDLHVARDEGTGTGGFTYDWGHHEVRIDNVHTHLRVGDVIYWIEPNFFHIVAPYKFRAAPNLVANGVVQYHGGDKTHLTITVDAPNGMDYVFLNKPLTLERVHANLLITDDHVQVAPAEGTLFGGSVKFNAEITTKETDSHYSASVALNGVDFPKLTDLYFKYQTAHGQLAGRYDWQARGNDAHSMTGTGEMAVSNGDVFAIPVFGPLSNLIASIFPGAGFSIAKQATASFSIREGVIRTSDLKVSGKAYDMLGHGEIDFINDKMNMDMRIGARGAGAVLTPLYNLFEYKGEGTVEKPNWHPKNF